MNNPKWIHAEERLPSSGPDVFILCEDSERMTGDRGTILSLQKSGYRDILWLDESGLEKDEQAEGKGTPEYQFLEFTSAHYKKGFDHFSIWMKDDNGKSYVTEFNGKFGRLLFAPQLVKKAAKVREVLEMLLEGWGDEWTDYTKKLVEKTIARAKNWTEKTPGAPPSVEADQQDARKRGLKAFDDSMKNTLGEIIEPEESPFAHNEEIECLKAEVEAYKKTAALMGEEVNTLRSYGQIAASENKRDMEIVKKERDDAKRSTIDRLYQQILASGEPFSPAIREVFHKEMNGLGKFTKTKDNG